MSEKRSRAALWSATCWLIAMAAAAPAGCFLYEDNPNYCKEGESCAAKCDTDAQCSGATAVCELDQKICVQCTATRSEACTGATPVCGATLACRGCQAHGECGSAVCLPSGACAAEGDVAYVAERGSGTECSKGQPCATLRQALTTSKAVVKVGLGMVKDDATTVIDGRAVTIVADPGAKLDRDGDGPILTVRSTGTDVKIYDLEVTGASGTGANGIQLEPNGGMPRLTLGRVKVTGNQGVGIASTGGTLTVSQSTVASNTGGGISVMNGTFDVTNSFIYRNGDQDASTFGGMNLVFAVAAGNRFEFNTITDNRAVANSGGVVCNVPLFAAGNNILARNSLAGNPNATNAQELGDCMYPSSRIQNDVEGLAFEKAEPPAPFNYKLRAGSTAIDQATTASTVVVDFEGDARPQGAQKDIGADEYKP